MGDTYIISKRHSTTGKMGNSYKDLNDKPKINNVELLGNKTADDLSLVKSEPGKGLSENDFTDEYKTNIEEVREEVRDSRIGYDGEIFDTAGNAIRGQISSLIEKINKHNVYDIVVAKDGTGDFTSLTEAVENAKDFATIYVKNGIYGNEIVKAWLKTVFIVGESREGVVIKNNTGAYATAPIEMGTGMLKNLTVYAEGNATPSNKGYALHSESSVSASSCNFFILENCTIKSDYRQSWGMGMRGDTHYYARNCTFERVYFHDCEHAHRATNQYVEFDSCNIIAKADGTALLLQDQQMSGANIDLIFNRCLIKSEAGKTAQYGLWTGSGIIWVDGLDDMANWHLNTFSFGNSYSALNA